MKALISSVMLVACLLAAPIAYAQTPTVTATCKDGTNFSGTTRFGACRGHQGVATWNSPTASTTTAPGIAPAAPPATRTATTPAMPSATIPGKAAPGSVAAKGGPGQVWVNSATKIYHCPGDRYYGKTKSGEFMPLAAAQAAGDHPAAGKACSS